jgi:DNA-binding MarR family transcriptional regulator
MNLRLFELIMLIRKRCLATEEKIRDEFGLSAAEFGGLLVIEPGDRILCHDFSARMGLSPSRGSRVIDRLIKKGYLRAEAVPNDRRCSLLLLMRKGVNLKKKIEIRMDECEQRILSSLSSRQGRQLVDSLKSLATAMLDEQAKVQTG